MYLYTNCKQIILKASNYCTYFYPYQSLFRKRLTTCIKYNQIPSTCHYTKFEALLLFRNYCCCQVSVFLILKSNLFLIQNSHCIDNIWGGGANIREKLSLRFVEGQYVELALLLKNSNIEDPTSERISLVDSDGQKVCKQKSVMKIDLIDRRISYFCYYYMITRAIKQWIVLFSKDIVS